MREETVNLKTKPVTRLGEWLVHRGLIRREELFSALNTAYRHNCRIGDAVVWMDLLDRSTVELEANRYHQQAVCLYHHTS
jgi:hypothetical protein